MEPLAKPLPRQLEDVVARPATKVPLTAGSWPAELEPRIDTDTHGLESGNIRVHPCPSVAEKTMDLADEQRAWVERCASLLAQVDDDGILCIPPVRGEASAADSLLKLLAVAYGEAWSNDTLSALLRGVDHGGKTLESWLRDKFFVQHCRQFQQRPFMLAGDVGRKGAGVLREKPNIKWEKDRGKDVESAPWFPVFKGERITLKTAVSS